MRCLRERRKDASRQCNVIRRAAQDDNDMSSTNTGSSGAPSPLALAFALSLGAAVSLGSTRFAYGLLLPPMRADLGWSYTFAGSMNTSNANRVMPSDTAAPSESAKASANGEGAPDDLELISLSS